jgi:hypothetical protein
MEKQLENLEKRKRQSSPAGPARPSQSARPRRLIGWRHRSVAVSAPRAFPLPPSALWGQLVGASCFPPAHPSSLSASRARSARRRAVAPRSPSLSLSLRRGPSLLAPPSPRPPWTSERALVHVTGILSHVTLPTPQLLLSPARVRTHSPALFHTVPPSLVLCSCRQTSPETRARLPGHLARRRPRQATPSSTLR